MQRLGLAEAQGEGTTQQTHQELATSEIAMAHVNQAAATISHADFMPTR
jgi:hypothetical protein